MCQIPSYEQCLQSKMAFAEAFHLAYQEQDPIRGKAIAQGYNNKIFIQNPPAPLLSSQELDYIYDLPYQRKSHPRYKGREIPALSEVKFSIVSQRGCFGACSFCANIFIKEKSYNHVLKSLF